MPPRVLLASAFKPFGVDDPYSRRESKIELYHNQLTREQGVFSMRDFMNTFGLHVIANNIEVPTTVLDFPTLARFERELRNDYDVVGIGAILPNLMKVKKMAETARRVSPRSKIVVGGFCATLPRIKELTGADEVCVGEGIGFMRALLGLPEEFEFKNPDIFAQSTEIFGVPLIGIKNPHIVVGLGCSYGCDFCSPSHFFGRRHLKFFTDGRKLFEEMVRVEKRFGSNLICFIGDDNFLLDLKRAEELRQAVVESGKVFNLFLFGSADRVIEFGPEKLAEMGCGTIWIGRESRLAAYRKNRGVDMPALVAELRRYGIKTILSSILLLDGHTKENMKADVDEHLACNPAFSQFSLYSPVPGTPLWERLKEENRILESIPFEDCHAFKQPWFIHSQFSLLEAERAQTEAYRRDFFELGPSVMRFMAADFEGWQNLKDSPKPILRARAEFFAHNMWKYRALLPAMEVLAPTAEMKALIRETRRKIESCFGPANLAFRAAAAGIFVAGRVREFRTRYFGDGDLQPRTRVVRYNERN